MSAARALGPSETSRAFRRRLKQAMAARQMSARALSREVRQSVYLVYRWRQGRSCPHLALVPMLAAALGVPAEWLAFGSGPNPLPSEDGAA